MRSFDNILSVIDRNADTILKNISAKVKVRRLEMNLTQEGLASRAGISYGTYRRFETSGDISLRNLVMVAMALNSVDDFDKLFPEPTYRSISDLSERNIISTRKRGKRNE
ncbi:helix-turn-helix transcriptional regulator [Proteiniphilum propionicum]|jgi:transcriptional regulator with XRE-family HTH domain|nr:helix-turn-helix transcriptional regulator [Proteiniphilum propionicum]HBF95809.1 XRE family transcriptional regulator [Porphyromonadaceae bacterium]HBU46355.1 XRE family transcriptional regulator [Porphyromonadaceae bacterium]